MPKPSTLKLLPKEIKAEIDRMIVDGGWTIDEIVEHLANAGHPRSRSAVGRYRKDVDETAAQLRESREITETLAKELGPDITDGKQGRLLVEMFRTLVFDSLTARIHGDSPDLEPNDFFFVAKALKEVAQANRLDQDFEEKLRSRIQKDVGKKLDELEKEGATGERRVDADTLAIVRRDIYGIVGPAK